MRYPPSEFATVVLRCNCPAPLARVYTVLSDAFELARLGVAGDDAVLILEEADFRVGGADRYRLGPKGHPSLVGETVYHDIVPGRRIVSIDVVADGDVRLSVALTTLELTALGQHTDVRMTAQAVTLGGGEAPSTRHQVLMGNLQRYLGGAPDAPRRPVLAIR